ncbi:LOW QUALITY PROTEIN: hypothetical protein HID58_025385 [Brassica napus]|uniref:Uncharacterized protein n=1 Tax=Brassica napus TaxID=3708 RepID=A0ABQ8CMV8_BRANA|nr:LOW QUALITY PROTEIN: hypothetical protein HID58_025385 [Brassica napus]
MCKSLMTASPQGNNNCVTITKAQKLDLTLVNEAWTELFPGFDAHGSLSVSCFFRYNILFASRLSPYAQRVLVAGYQTFFVHVCIIPTLEKRKICCEALNRRSFSNI